jgi:hypothetical protein
MSEKQLPLAFRIPNPDLKQHYLEEMNVRCSGCGAIFFRDEIPHDDHSPFYRCCLHGALQPHRFPNFPQELKNLYNGNDEMSALFHHDVRKYNNALAFASTTVTHVKIPGPAWPYVYKISGEYYRSIHAVMDDDNTNRCFGHYWIYDPIEGTKERLKSPYSVNLDADLLLRLTEIEQKHNPMCAAYQSIYKVAQEVEEKNPNHPELVKNLVIEFDPNLSNRNPLAAPVGNDLAAVFDISEGGCNPREHIMVYYKDYKEKKINILRPLVDTFAYPIFFLNEGRCWNFKDKHTGIFPKKKKEEGRKDQFSMVMTLLRLAPVTQSLLVINHNLPPALLTDRACSPHPHVPVAMCLKPIQKVKTMLQIIPPNQPTNKHTLLSNPHTLPHHVTNVTLH